MAYFWRVEWEYEERVVWSNDPVRPVGWVNYGIKTRDLRRRYATPNDAVQARRALQKKHFRGAKWSLQYESHGSVAKTGDAGGASCLQVGSSPTGHRDS